MNACFFIATGTRLRDAPCAPVHLLPWMLRREVPVDAFVRGAKQLHYFINSAMGEVCEAKPVGDDNFHTSPNGSGYPIVIANVLWNFFKTQRLP